MTKTAEFRGKIRKQPSHHRPAADDDCPVALKRPDDATSKTLLSVDLKTWSTVTSPNEVFATASAANQNLLAQRMGTSCKPKDQFELRLAVDRTRHGLTDNQSKRT